MKKCLLTLLLLPALLLSGCAGQEEAEAPEGAYQIYYAVDMHAAGGQTTEARRQEGKSIDWEYRVPEATTAAALVELVMSTPQTYGLMSPVQPETSLRWAELEEDGRLHLDMSGQYGSLSGAGLTLANACLAFTLTQLEGVESIYITVEGETIPYQALQTFRVSDFLLSDAQE